MKKPRSQTEALEQWSPINVAWAIERGLVDTTPLTFTRRGWAWFKRRRRGYVYADDVPPAEDT